MINNEPYAKNVNFYPWQDAVEKYRVSTPQSMIDTDFEYSLQGTKWEQVELMNNYPSVFIRAGEPLYTGDQILSVSASHEPSGTRQKEVVVTLNNIIPDIPFAVGNPISIKDTLYPALFDGQYIISKVYNLSTFSYISKNRNPAIIGQVQTPYTALYTGGFFQGSQLALSALVAVPNTNEVRAIFRTPHGLFINSPIYVVDPSIGVISGPQTQSVNTNLALSGLSGIYLGSFNVTKISSDTELVYPVLSTFNSTSTRLETLSTTFRVRTEGYATHRWADGGVSITPGTIAPNSQMIRQTRKYFRYQSGKGVQFSTGVVFRPTYDVARTTVNFDRYNFITNPFVEWTLYFDQEAGFYSADSYREGATIRTTGFAVSAGSNPYNGVFTVSAAGADLRSLTVSIPYDNNTVFDVQPGGIGKVEALYWRDATVRTGLFDDQNGLFFEYDGERLYVVKRSATQQLAGFVSLSANSASVSGTNTKFKTQLKETDYIVLKGQPYVVTKILNDNQLFVAPDYRGVDIPALNLTVKATKVVDDRIPQSQFNVDPLDGTGPSGYVFDPQKMQMIFIDYAWYGAGKIRYGVRGQNGNIIYFHEIPQNNVNTEAYMRSGNLPARFEIQTKSKAGLLPYGLTTTADTLSVYNSDASFLPSSGRVIINNEYIRYVKTGLSDLTATQLSIIRNDAGLTELLPASANDSFITFNQNFAPNLSHWGVANIMDGRFDEDKSYLFTAANSGICPINLQQFGRSVPVPLISIRLAPSVDYGQPGDFGVRNLVNRSALVLKNIGIQTNISLQILLRLNYDNNAIFPISGFPSAFRQMPERSGANPINQTSEISWQKVGNGSLAQYVDWSQPYNIHARLSGFGGDIIGAFFADGPETGGSATRYAVTTIPIDIIRELSNSIVGGRNTYPDGPDVLTIFALGVVPGTQFGLARCRISWTESQG